MKWYPWLNEHLEKFVTNYRTNRVHHALLIQAPFGVGDEILIHSVARFLMCYHSQKYNNYCECRSCHLMQMNIHPDYYVLKPENNRVVLGIDVIRAVREKIYKCAKIGREKVVYFPHASSFTEEAANSLLKIIEEPPERTWFFLSCCDPRFLLTTLKSRCVLYRISVPQESLALEWLQHKISMSKDMVLTALRIYNGAPIAALTLLNPSIYTQRADLCLSLEKSIRNYNWLSLLPILDHKRVTERLYWLILLFLDAIKIQQDIALISNLDNLALVKMLACYIPNTILQNIFRDMCRCRKQLLTITSINRELLLTNQLLRIENYFESEGK